MTTLLWGALPYTAFALLVAGLPCTSCFWGPWCSAWR